MVELYCSWCKGLPESKEALKMLKDSGVFTGIELSNTDFQADKIIDAGLKVSIHNPVREFKINLDNASFTEILNAHPEIISHCNKTELPFVSFHTNYIPSLNPATSYELVLKNVKDNLNKIKNTLSKKVLFETSCGFGKSQEYVVSELLFKCTHPSFAKQILSETSAGVLIDISHVLASASLHKVYNNYPNEVKDFFLDYLSVCSKSTYEMHINSTRINEQGLYIDRHFPLNPEEKETQLAFECATEVINSCPNIETVVLEVEPNLDPINHVKLLIQQAQLFEKMVLKK